MLGEPRRGRRHLVDGSPGGAEAAGCGRRWRCSCRTAWRWSRARRPSAAPTSTASAPRSGPPAPRPGGATRARSRSETRCSAGSAPGRARRLARRLGCELAAAGVELIATRARGDRPAGRPASPRRPRRSASSGAAKLAYRPRSEAADAERLRPSSPSAARPISRRGYTGRGPHLDELAVERGGRAAAPLRLAGRAASRAAGAAVRRAPSADRRRPAAAADAPRRRHQRARRGAPRAARRAALAGGGQALVTATEPDQLPPVPAARDRDARGSGRSSARRRRRGRGAGGGVTAARPGRAARRGRSAVRAPTPRPATLLAAVQGRWRRGGRRADRRARPEPVAERDGVVTVACRTATWAQELDLLQDELLARLNARRSAGRRVERPVGFVVGRRSSSPRSTRLVRDLQGFCDDPARLSGGRDWYPYVNLDARPDPLGLGPRASGPSVGVSHDMRTEGPQRRSGKPRRAPTASARTGSKNDGADGYTSGEITVLRGPRPGAQAPRHVHRLDRARAACTTSSTRSSTTPSTRPSPATATRSRSRSTRTTASPSSTTAAGSRSTSTRRRSDPPPRSC